MSQTDSSSLEDGERALEAEPRVDALPGQRDELAVGLAVVLHEHQVPELDEPPLVAVERATLTPVLRALVVVDLRGGPARAGLAHLPEVVGAHALDPLGRHADLVTPDVGRFVVVDVDGDPQPVSFETEDLGHELPREGNGVGLEVVAEGEVPEHLEEAEVGVVATDQLDVVVLSPGCARTSAPRSPAVGRGLLAEEVREELVHARVGEQRRAGGAGSGPTTGRACAPARRRSR